MSTPACWAMICRGLTEVPAATWNGPLSRPRMSSLMNAVWLNPSWIAAKLIPEL